jgi:hypothetical protein
MGGARRLLHANAANALRKIQSLNGQLNAVVHVIEPSPSMAGVGEASGGMLGGFDGQEQQLSARRMCQQGV